jgi:predicted AAA+ superfamily ATPase
MYERELRLPLDEQSCFLFGPRQTGKTTLLARLAAGAPRFEVSLLDTATLLNYGREPGRFRREVAYWAERNPDGLVVVDEIQKLPALLDEIHQLLDSLSGRVTFVMTGSSARKLKRASANLLGGRAWPYALFPLTYRELGADFDLGAALRFGTLPPVIGRAEGYCRRFLKAYAQTYLKEEILQEALVRNVPAFGRFLELAADQSGCLVNYSNFAAETGVASKTVRDYYQVLEDTLVAFAVQPYVRSARKRLTTHPVYHLFDLGVCNALCGRLQSAPMRGTAAYGRLFEQFVVLELKRLLAYREKDWPLHYWRTSHGAEVDIVFETGSKVWAVEVKSGAVIRPAELGGLRSFREDHPGARLVCVGDIDRPFKAGDIECLPWREFLEQAGAGA